VFLIAAGIWALSAALNQAAPAAGPAATRVAVVNLVDVFNQYEQTKVLNRKLDEHRAKLQEESNRLTAEIETARQERDAFNMNTAEWHKKNEIYTRKRFEFGVWDALEKEKMVTGHKNWIQRTYESIVAEIEQVAKKNGYHICLTQEDLDVETDDTKILLRQIFNRKVVYADASVDISAEVLRNLNAAFDRAGGANSVQFGK
jgi:Skp family chaperone for outer membrane proteins